MAKGCKCATYDSEDGRWTCSVTGDGCMYMIPDSKSCAEDYGEGPDVPADESEGRVDNKNCFNCNWTKDFVNFEVAKLCVNELSGSYNTDVTQYECCNQWAESEVE